MEICRKYGINDATYYNWKTKHLDRESNAGVDFILVQKIN